MEVKPPRNPIEEALALGLDARFLEPEDREPEAVEWAKEIPGYSRYKATRDGEIIGVYGQRMNPHIDEGHLKVNIHGDDGKRTMHRVDFLVAKTFLGYNRKPRARVRIEHKDGSPFNCALDNLEVDYGLV